MSASELLAVFDDAGRRVGTKTRAAVHRDRDWHWLVFVWSAHLDPRGQARALFQVRSRPGDPHLGSLDAPAAGHVPASETHLLGARREFREEVGIELREDDLVYLGQRCLENAVGPCFRVIEHLYWCRRPIDLNEVTCSEETSGFVEVGLDDFIDLLEGRRQRVPGRGRFAADSEEVRDSEITPAALASYSEAIRDSFRHSMRQIRAVLIP